MNVWFSIQELLGISGLPKTDRGITKKAEREKWEKRQRAKTKGKTFEYHISSLPLETQQAIRLRYALAQLPEIEQNTAPKASVAQALNNATDKARAEAQEKVEALLVLQGYLDAKIPLMQALEAVSQQKGVSKGSLKNWFYKVKDYHIHEWQAVLIKQTGKNKKENKAQIDQEAWDVFLADYLRPEQPSIATSYRRAVELAHQMGWEIASKNTFKRRLMSEVPYEVIVLKRQGKNAVAKLVPALRRSVKDIFAMEWINGDGYQHNVFVEFPNGEIGRPKTWFWQDVRTRRILGYRTAISENTDSIRHALMDVIFQYGIPKTITLDNTRAAANKVMTGGVENRYRFKHDDELDPKGILPILGIEVHFTQVLYGEGHGQAKPIERAFGRGGIGELVDKQPALAGFYAGANIYNKPDNYNGGKKGVAWDTFLEALARGVQSYNAQTGRKTEMCQGKLSFDEVWQRDYHPSRVTQANPEQLRLLFLQSEKVRIKKNGEFTLKAGGKLLGLQNIYWAESLIGNELKQVIARFDPDNLHGAVYLYDFNGVFLSEAICRKAVSFKDTSAAREQGRYYKQIVKSAQKQARGMELLSALELAELQPKVDVPEPIEKRVKTVLIDQVIQDRNALQVVQEEVVIQEDEEELSAFERAFQKGVKMSRT